VCVCERENATVCLERTGAGLGAEEVWGQRKTRAGLVADEAAVVEQVASALRRRFSLLPMVQARRDSANGVEGFRGGGGGLGCGGWGFGM
jgi:hypothetical protein